VSRQTSLIGLGIGLAAAGVGAAVGLAAERLAVGRPIIRRFPHEDDEVPLGSLREVPLVVVTDDGTALHVEIDEPQRPDPDGLTVVFSHGYALNLDSCHCRGGCAPCGGTSVATDAPSRDRRGRPPSTNWVPTWPP
jgi:hypothetical protein